MPHVFLRFFISTALFFSSQCFSQTSIYFIETTMPTTPWTFGFLKHQGLGFKDKKREVECHFTEKGLLVVEKGEYGRKILRREKFARGKHSAGTYVEWCENWAAQHDYKLGAFDCWTMVEDFCKDHHIKNRRADHANWFRDIFMIRGAATGIAYTKINWKKNKKIKSLLYGISIPFYAVGYGLYSSIKVGFRDIKRIAKKMTRCTSKTYCTENPDTSLPNYTQP